jgi:rubrerythrin
VLDVEHAAIAAYTAGIPLLGHPAIDYAKQFLAHELSHVAELSALIHDGGGKPNAALTTYDLGHPRSAQDVLALLRGAERMTIGAYLDAIPKLTERRIRSTMASILANEAEHVSVLRTTLGERPVPSAFVTAVQ